MKCSLLPIFFLGEWKAPWLKGEQMLAQVFLHVLNLLATLPLFIAVGQKLGFSCWAVLLFRRLEKKLVASSKGPSISVTPKPETEKKKKRPLSTWIFRPPFPRSLHPMRARLEIKVCWTEKKQELVLYRCPMLSEWVAWTCLTQNDG